MTGLVLLEVNARSAKYRNFISEISEIARALSAPEHIDPSEREEFSQSGFLVSNYGPAKYRALARKSRLFAVVSGEHVVAFSVIYHPLNPADVGDFGTAFIRREFGAVPVVKQIGADRNFRGMGLSNAPKMLHDDLASRYPHL